MLAGRMSWRCGLSPTRVGEGRTGAKVSISSVEEGGTGARVGVSLMIGEGGIGIWTRVGISSMLIVCVFGVRISTGPKCSEKFVGVFGVRISTGPNNSARFIVLVGVRISTGPNGSGKSVEVVGVRISMGPKGSEKSIEVVGVRISTGPNGSEKLVTVSGVKVSTGPKGSAAGATTILETISGGSTERVCIVCCLVVLIEISKAVRNAEILLWRCAGSFASAFRSAPSTC